MSGVSDESAAICPKCQRPKATARDVIRWLNAMGRHGEVCLDGVDYSRIMPDEEVIPDAGLLKERLIEVRKQRDWLACLAIAGMTK